MKPRAGPVAARRRFEPLFRLALQLCRLETEILDFAQAVVAGDEARQNGLSPLGAKRAPHCDFDRVCERLRQIGEKRSHFVFALEIVLRARPATVVFDDVAPVGDAEQRVVRLVVGPRREIAFVRRHDRQVAIIGELEKLGLHVGFFGKPMPLQLDVKPVAEDLLERLQPLDRLIALPASERAVDRPLRAAGQHDQSSPTPLQGARS